MSRKSRILLLLLLISVFPLPSHAAASLELYGTFEAMGVIVTIAESDDPNGNASAALEYRDAAGTYRGGLPLSRVAPTRFVGSMFWLEPGQSYDVRVTFADPDGDPLDGVIVQASASTRPEIAIPTAGHSYYVSPGGSGSDCTLANPCSLAEGLGQVQAGQEIVLRGGTYYSGETWFPRSGSAGSPIVLRGYQGETAVLDGADPNAFAWTSYGGGVYQATVNVPDTHLVTADGQRLFPYESLSDLQSLAWGSPGHYTEGSTLYVRLPGDADPNNATMVVSRYNHAFEVGQDFVYFSDLTFRHYGQGSWAKAMYFNGGSDNLVQGCTFASNDLGIGLKREAHRNTIQDNEFYDTIFDWSWDGIKTTGGLEDGGVAFYDPTDGRGNVVRRNTFHDDFDGLNLCPDSSTGLTNETDFYDNLLYNLGDDGIETDGQCSNVRLWGNTFHDVLMGISFAPVYTGPVYAVRNLIYRTGVGNNSYSGSPFKFNSGYGQSGPMYLLHNTADAALPGNNGLYIKEPGSWTMIYARNNVWAGTNYAVENYHTSQPIDLDYDDLWNAGANDLVRWDNVRYATLAEFSAATGQESHGLNVVPGFAGPSYGNYTLAPDSALIDAGLPIPGINDDYAGSAPDVGAFEYRESSFTLSPSPPLRTIAAGGSTHYTIDVQPNGSFSATVHLTATSPSPSLTLHLEPAAVVPPGQVTLTVSDTHASPLLPGLWYTLPLTASGGGLVLTTSVDLLVGGRRLYLPLVVTSN